MRSALLPAIFFTHYENADGCDYWIPCYVTDQCYRALKQNGFLLDADERRAFMRHYHLSGIDRSKTFGCPDGFTFRELRAYPLIQAHKVRQWPEYAEIRGAAA